MENTDNTSLKLSMSRIVGDLLTDPAVKLSLGNVALAHETAGSVGLVLTSLTASAAAAARVYESATKKSIGLPYYILAAVNGITAGSVIQNGYQMQGLDGLGFGLK